MKWNKYSIQTTTEAVDLISSMLYDLGLEGIEIEDKAFNTKDVLENVDIINKSKK